MKIFVIIIATLFFASCSSYVFDNPLDKSGTNYIDGAADDDDFDGIINYNDDDDSDGIANYKDLDSKYSNGEYHLKLELEQLKSKENLQVKNDGSLIINTFKLNSDLSYIEKDNSVEFLFYITNKSGINRISFDYDGNGEYDDSLGYNASSRMHYYSKEGIYNVALFVRDNIGNLAYDTVSILVYGNSNKTQPPQIELLGEDTVSISQNETFQEPGFFVTDDVFTNGELNKFVYVNSGDLEANFVDGSYNSGVYAITYIVYDTDGNRATTVRYVEVK